MPGAPDLDEATIAAVVAAAIELCRPGPVEASELPPPGGPWRFSGRWWVAAREAGRR